MCGAPSGRPDWVLRRPAALLPWERAQRQFDARRLGGPATLTGARQVLLLPPFRADFRTAPRVRHGGDPRLRRAEVRVPELLLSADDPRRLLRRPAVRGAGWAVRRGPGSVLSERAGPGHAAGGLRRRPARAPPPGRGFDPHGRPGTPARRVAARGARP